MLAADNNKVVGNSSRTNGTDKISAKSKDIKKLSKTKKSAKVRGSE